MVIHKCYVHLTEALMKLQQEWKNDTNSSQPRIKGHSDTAYPASPPPAAIHQINAVYKMVEIKDIQDMKRGYVNPALDTVLEDESLLLIFLLKKNTLRQIRQHTHHTHHTPQKKDTKQSIVPPFVIFTFPTFPFHTHTDTHTVAHTTHIHKSSCDARFLSTWFSFTGGTYLSLYKFWSRYSKPWSTPMDMFSAATILCSSSCVSLLSFSQNHRSSLSSLFSFLLFYVTLTFSLPEARETSD